MEVIIKTFMDKRMQELCTPIIFGSSKVASFHRKAMGIEDFSFNVVENAYKANNKKANLINCWKEEAKITLGEIHLMEESLLSNLWKRLPMRFKKMR